MSVWFNCELTAHVLFGGHMCLCLWMWMWMWTWMWWNMIRRRDWNESVEKSESSRKDFVELWLGSRRQIFCHFFSWQKSMHHSNSNSNSFYLHSLSWLVFFWSNSKNSSTSKRFQVKIWARTTSNNSEECDWVQDSQLEFKHAVTAVAWAPLTRIIYNSSLSKSLNIVKNCQSSDVLFLPKVETQLQKQKRSPFLLIIC
jgi:hypothetical protein